MSSKTECQQHGYTFDEAVFFFYDWWKRDPYVALQAITREARAGTYAGQPLCERVMEAMAADHLKMCGTFSQEFQVPARPPRFDRRNEVRPVGNKLQAVPTMQARPAPPLPRAVTPPAPRGGIPPARRGSKP